MGDVECATVLHGEPPGHRGLCPDMIFTGDDILERNAAPTVGPDQRCSVAEGACGTDIDIGLIDPGEGAGDIELLVQVEAGGRIGHLTETECRDIGMRIHVRQRCCDRVVVIEHDMARQEQQISGRCQFRDQVACRAEAEFPGIDRIDRMRHAACRRNGDRLVARSAVEEDDDCTTRKTLTADAVQSRGQTAGLVLHADQIGNIVGRRAIDIALGD
ncbi:hypothetical protein WR25_21010 [Diploscapter pachys]|uniref:Uncharacterized protein n=1 Tax=Diploscapter pachys TaxID=2018661 RepID=A0A2A2KGB4_9BILA|nr:hypothetical protein WR25_21010 [Diploscapter pachys]